MKKVERKIGGPPIFGQPDLHSIISSEYVVMLRLCGIRDYLENPSVYRSPIILGSGLYLRIKVELGDLE